MKNSVWKYLLPLLLAFVIVSIFSFSSVLYRLNPWSDANIYLTIGRGLLNGKDLYRDLFDHKGPLLYWLYAFLAFIGKGGFGGVWAFEVICMAVYLWACDEIGRLFQRRDGLLFGTFSVWLMVSCRAFSFGGGSVEEISLPIFQVINLIVLAKVRKSESFSCRDAAVLGCLSAVLFLMKFTLIGYPVGAAVFLIVYQYRKDRSKVRRCVLSGILSFLCIHLITSLILVCQGIFQEYINAYYVFNLFGYQVSAGFVDRIYRMVRAFFFYIKNNPLMMLFSAAGLGCAVVLPYRKGNRMIGVYFLSVFICWYMVSFAGGRFIAYYILPMGIFSMYLFLAVKETFRKAGYSLFLLISLAAVVCSYNLKQIGRTNYVQYEFADIMNADGEDVSMLVYEGYDQGFYMVMGQTPACRYFTKVNGDIEGAAEQTQACIYENRIDYLVSMDNEIELEGYELVREVNQEYDGAVHTYRLYRNSDEK